MVINVIITGIDNLVNHVQKIKEAANEAKSAIKDIKSEFDTLSSSTNEIKTKFAELAQGVENLGKANQSRGKLTTEDYDEFLNLSNQLAELYPQLTKGYDENGNAILNLSGNVNTITSSLEDLLSVQQRLANQQILEKMPDVWAGYKVDLAEYNQSLKNSESHVKSFRDTLNSLQIDSDKEIVTNKYSTHQNILKAVKSINIDPTSLYKEKRTNFDKGTGVFQSATWDFSSLTEEQLAQLKNQLAIFESEYEKAIQLTKGKIQESNSSISSYINTWISSEWNFSQMNSDMQNVVKDVLFNSDWLNSIPNNIDSKKWDEVSNWLQNEFLYPITKIDSEEIQGKLKSAFNDSFNSNALQELINQLSDEGFDENNPLTIYLQSKLDNRIELEDNVKDILQAEFDDKVGELPLEDLKIAAEQIELPERLLLSWDELIELIEEAKTVAKEATNDIPPKSFDISEAIDNSTKSVKLLNTAIDEMNDTGHISASTYAEIIEAGGNFAKCLEVQNGQLTLNIEKLKELEAQEYLNAISANNLRISQIRHLDWIDEYSEEIDELIKKNKVYQYLIDELNNASGSENTGTTTDSIKEAFEAEMKDIEHLHNMELISDEEYYNALETANENHYKDSLEKESEYNSNIEKIYNGRKNIYKENVDKQAEELENAYKKGFLTAKEYRSEMQKLAETSYGVGTVYFNTEFASENYDDLINKSLDLDSDIYEEELEKIKSAEDGSLETHQKVIENWKKLNSKMFEGIDPKKYKENLEEIEKADQDFLKDYVDKQVSDLEEAFDKGFITAEELRSKLQNLADTFYGEGTTYFGTDFATENYSSIMDKVNDTNSDVYKERLNELKKADDGSLESHKEFIENWKQLAYEMFAGVDPKKYKEILDEIDECEEDFWNDRVEKEKEYWENQKQAVIDDYDEEIKKLEDIADEEERINKQEELRLNLIKAQQDLLNAKKNRNQLVFSNGGFEYTYDQEAVESANEAVKNAEQAIVENERKEEIELLKEQKENDVEYYNKILKVIRLYIDKTVPLTESDKEVFDEIMNSPYAKLANQETQINPKADVPQTQTQSNESKSSEDKSDKKDKDKSDKKSEQKAESKPNAEFKPDFSNLFNQSKFLMEAINSRSVEGMSKVFDFVGESVMQAAQYPMWGQSANAVYNNSTITNNNDNKQITIGDIHVNVQGGTSDEMINEFAQKLSAALAECSTREIYSKNRR